MGWLTDSDRRADEWRQRVGARPDIHEPHVIRLPGGGLRFEQVYVDRGSTTRQVVEDVAIRDHNIHRMLRGEVTSPHFVGRGRWIVKQRITVSSLEDATSIRVRTRGRPAGWTLAYQHFGYADTTWGRRLTELAIQWTDSFVADVTNHFAG